MIHRCRPPLGRHLMKPRSWPVTTQNGRKSSLSLKVCGFKLPKNRSSRNTFHSAGKGKGQWKPYTPNITHTTPTPGQRTRHANQQRSRQHNKDGKKESKRQQQQQRSSRRESQSSSNAATATSRQQSQQQHQHQQQQSKTRPKAKPHAADSKAKPTDIKTGTTPTSKEPAESSKTSPQPASSPNDNRQQQHHYHHQQQQSSPPNRGTFRGRGGRGRGRGGFRRHDYVAAAYMGRPRPAFINVDLETLKFYILQQM